MDRKQYKLTDREWERFRRLWKRSKNLMPELGGISHVRVQEIWKDWHDYTDGLAKKYGYQSDSAVYSSLEKVIMAYPLVKEKIE